MEFHSGAAPTDMRWQYLILVDHLKTQPPEVWHAVTLSWNWDNPPDILTWIAQQPSCEKSTAQAMFHLASPESMLVHAAEGGSSYRSEIALCKTVSANWNARVYTNSTLESFSDFKSLADEAYYREAESSVTPEKRAWTIDSSIFNLIAGRIFDLDSISEYIEGYPPSVFERLKASGVWLNAE